VGSFCTVIMGVGIHTDYFAPLRRRVEKYHERFRRISHAASQRRKDKPELARTISA